MLTKIVFRQVSGTWSYPAWFANWLIPLVHRNDAIIVSPNYRLIPEHNGDDIQEDLADFWAWYVRFDLCFTVTPRLYINHVYLSPA